MTRLLSIGEAADRLALHPATLRRWCAQGFPGAVRIGDAWRVDPEQVERVAREGWQPPRLRAVRRKA